ncbi:hypothetical protein ACS0TY_031938 [Phlomoides rotata]
MESRKRKPNLNSYPASPLPNPPSSSSIFRDISNFNTPKHPLKTPSFQASPQFFTALKNTPSSSFRRGPKTSALKSKAARRLKAFELEQSKSARKAQSEKDRSLKSLARSLTVWLNFLFENPCSCGCDPASFTGEFSGSGSVGVTEEVIVNNGKRESGPSRSVGVDGPWRGPKRQRGLLWRGEVNDELGRNVFSNSMFSRLRTSLQDICSFEDLKERMRMYLSLDGCKEVCEAMTQVTKNIDEGRLKMKASCPIVSDVGMKEKALRVLTSYNPMWLRIGLYVILGGDSLLPNGDVTSEQENAFLRMVLEKQFFSHTGLAKAHAYNKQVEGLYRPGYYDKLGNVILKRFLLLVIILDRTKCQTSLPLKYGIDGLDGGSPPLFSLKSNIKSSRQVIIDFLPSDVMHGEGNLLAHLLIVGYKVTYQQNPLIEYDFKVTDLFEDLRDGIRLCRAIGLLKHDPSILMKVLVPSDSQKKSLVNCGIALQYLRQAGVSLLDEDGTEIIGEDVVNGDKELTLSLLWNMFIHLQLPLLINKTYLSEEIANIRGAVVENSSTQLPLDLLLNWIQAVCETYDFKVESPSSLLDGKAMWCLLDYYFRKEQDCSCSFKDQGGTKGEVSIMSAIEYTDAVYNFILSQKLTSLLGNFPEVLQVSDILEHNGACNGQTVIVLLVFLSVQLLVKRNMDKLNFHKLLGFGCQNLNSSRLSTVWNDEKDPSNNFKSIMAWWQDMAQQNGKCSLNPDIFNEKCFLNGRKDSAVQRENAATIIQSHYRRLVERRNYMKITNAALVLQSVTLAWLSVKKKESIKELMGRSELKSSSSNHTARGKPLEKFGMYHTFMADRHYFVNLRKSITVIQQAIRVWNVQRHYKTRSVCNKKCILEPMNVASVSQSCNHGLRSTTVYTEMGTPKHKGSVAYEEDGRDDLESAAAITIQNSWKGYIFSKSFRSRHIAATKIQSHYRGWFMRKSFACKKRAIKTIQRSFRCSRTRRYFQVHEMKNESAVIIQSHLRGWMARREVHRERDIFIRIQSYCRGWLQRKEYLLQNDAAKKIQSSFHCMNCRKAFVSQRHAAIDIQCYIRGKITRRRLLGAFYSQKNVKFGFEGLELKIFLQSVLKLQRWWRYVLQVRVKTKSAAVIQSHFRGWIASQMVKREMQCVVVIQTYWKGYLARKDVRGQQLDLQLRAKSALVIQSHFQGWIARRMAKREKQRVVLIQSYWKGYFARKDARGQQLDLQLRTKSAIVIQSHFRGWIARRMAKREKQRVVLIQSYWKGYLARKDARGQLLDLRMRMQKSAANVDDNRRLINRLILALSELLSMKSISNILHTCATLDVATELSQRCCEELVAAGAIGTLLKLIRSVSRSIPDQQVLKHALSTLRNLARFPNLAEVLVESRGCAETVVLEFIRNKEEGYFIAAELLKRMFKCEIGALTVRKSPALLKRLNNLAEDLSRKAGHDKRNARNLVARENAERRLKVVVELLKIITNA